MRRLLTMTMILACLGVVLWLGYPTLAALTKTTTITTVDAWQAVVAGTMVVGTPYDLSASYGEAVLYVEVAPKEATATDGAEARVYVSYGSENYVLLTTMKATAETPATTTVNDETAALGDTTITLTDATTGDFDVVARRWFILDGTIANSESVVTVVNSTHTVTLMSGLTKAHANGVNVYDRADAWAVKIPFGVSRVLVTCNNVDADCDCAFTSRISKVTRLY